MSVPKLKNVKILPSKQIYLEFSDGVDGVFSFEDYFNYKGVLKILKNEKNFKKACIKNNSLHWTDECELSTDTLYAIITKSVIIVDEKIVFNPKLGKEAWVRENY
jgi:hypothetical protein